MNFAMTDVYGGVWGTTETTIPEAADQNALVDDQKAAVEVSDTGKKKLPIAAAIIGALVLCILFGVVK